MNTFAQNLDYYLSLRKITREQVAKELGVSTATVIHWANGRRFPKNEYYIKELAKILNITEQDLFDPSKKEQIAKDEVKKQPLAYLQDVPEVQLLEDMVSFPFVTIGAGAEALANIELMESIYLPKKILPFELDPKNTLVGKVLGDSMEPKYQENDIIIFDMVNGRDVIFNDGVFLVRYGDIVQVKSVQFLGNNDIKIISFNDTYPPVQPKKDLDVDWDILGKPICHWSIKTYSKFLLKDDMPQLFSITA